MPSAPGYKRDIPQEKKTAAARGEVARDNERKKARRLLVKEGRVKINGGQDVDHIVPLSRGGSNDPSNLRVKSESSNRSFARTKTGAIK